MLWQLNPTAYAIPRVRVQVRALCISCPPLGLQPPFRLVLPALLAGPPAGDAISPIQRLAQDSALHPLSWPPLASTARLRADPAVLLVRKGGSLIWSY